MLSLGYRKRAKRPRWTCTSIEYLYRDSNSNAVTLKKEKRKKENIKTLGRGFVDFSGKAGSLL